MKTILNIVISVTLGCSCISCSDFLNLSPYSEITAENFYQNEEDFTQAINGAYQPLRNMYNTEEWNLGEAKSDNTTYIIHIAKSSLDGEDPDQFRETSTNGNVGTKYNNCYVIIGRANRIISEIDKADFGSEAKNNLKGQALFLRAFSYFSLVQYFGGVPLHTIPSTVYEDAFKPRASVEEVYEQIIKDAQEASNLLPVKSKQEPGRVSKGTAQTLLGNVYIVLKRWAEAEHVLKEIVSSNEYELLADYGSIYSTANKNHKESIFEIQYMQDASLGQQSDFIYRFLPYLTNPSAITGTTPDPCPSNVDHGGFNTPTVDLINAYEKGDKRLDASIGMVEGRLTDSYSLDAIGVKSIIDYMAPPGMTAYPFIKKYFHEHTKPYYTDDNWPVYRYAEVLLFLAEAVNEQNRPDEAVTYLNNVFGQNSIRGRAGLAPVTVQNVDALRNVIYHERRIELAFENKRWTDLLRTGLAVEVMTRHGQNIKDHPELYYWPEGVQPVANAYVFNPDKCLLPIPLREIDLNKALKQNPGY